MRIIPVVWTIINTARDRSVTLLAASIAYYAFVSLIPLLILVLTIGSILGGEVFAKRIVQSVQDVFTPAVRDSLQQALTNPSGHSGAGIMSLGTLLWSALSVFRGLDRAFAEIYHTTADVSLLEQLIDGVIIIVMVGTAIVLIVISGTVLQTSAIVAIPFGYLLSSLALVITLLIVFSRSTTFRRRLR